MSDDWILIILLAVALGGFAAMIYCVGERIYGVNEPGYKDKSKGDDYGS